MRQWAISVGINQYQFLQPLSYAQQDAQAIHSFLIEDVGLAAEQCLLLTETSPPHWGKATDPSRDTIQSWLDLLTQQYLEPGDMLWCFFSGYGMCQQGQDYLMPIDGDPAAIQATAIPLETVFRRLSRVPTQALVLLDINRSESSFSYETVGNHTIHLASITGIPTLLSCQPEQFARETSALGHGFFTAALLESLRNRQCTTIAALDQYLSQHLPTLSDQYWRPIQQAVTICPNEKRQQLLVSPLAARKLNQKPNRNVDCPASYAMQNGVSLAASRTALQPVVKPASSASDYIPYSWLRNGTGTPATAAADPSLSTSYSQFAHSQSVSGNVSGNSETIAPATIAATATNHSTSGIYGTPNGSATGVNGSTSAATQAIRAGSTGSNGMKAEYPLDSATQNHQNRVTHPAPASTVPQPPSPVSEETNEIPDALFWRPTLLWGSLVVIGLVLGVLLRNCAAFSPKAPSTAQQAAVPGAGQANRQPLAPVQASAKPGLPVEAANPAASKVPAPQPIAAAQSFGAAGVSRLNQSPASPTIAVKPPQPTQPAKASPPAKPIVQSPLAKARARVTVNSDQASPYWYAIQDAKTIKPGQLDYAQAQQEIATWSRQIISIARTRGRLKNYDTAIMAARLVQEDQPSYPEAKSLIAQWSPLVRSSVTKH